MPIVYSLACINNRLQGVVNTIDGGAGNGIMNIFTSSGALCASITLNKPSGTISNGVLTFSGVPLTAPTLVTGALFTANITDSNSNLVVSGLTVGNSSLFDLIMPVTSVLSGNLVALTFGSITGS